MIYLDTYWPGNKILRENNSFYCGNFLVMRKSYNNSEMEHEISTNCPNKIMFGFTSSLPHIRYLGHDTETVKVLFGLGGVCPLENPVKLTKSYPA